MCFFVFFLFCSFWFGALCFFFFFFNDTATTEIYTLSLHDALPISCARADRSWAGGKCDAPNGRDRKSTRLNSSHQIISYAVFCLKKKKKKKEKRKKIKKKKKKKKKKKTKKQKQQK